MKIEIPEWIKKSGKYVLTGVGAVAGLLLVQNAQTADEALIQIYMTADSITVIEKGDTVSRAITESDKQAVYRGNVLYDNGYTQHVFTHKTVDLLTGDVTFQQIVSTIPKIGTQLNWKIRHGVAELAQEKIPEKLETLPVEKANEIGWFAVIDTMVTKDDKGSEVKREPEKVWTTDSKQKPVVKDVSVDAGTATDPIETIPDGTK